MRVGGVRAEAGPAVWGYPPQARGDGQVCAQNRQATDLPPPPCCMWVLVD